MPDGVRRGSPAGVKPDRNRSCGSCCAHVLDVCCGFPCEYETERRYHSTGNKSVEHSAHDCVGEQTTPVGEDEPVALGAQQAVADGSFSAIAFPIAQRV